MEGLRKELGGGGGGGMNKANGKGSLEKPTYSPFFSNTPYLPLFNIRVPFHTDAYLWKEERVKRSHLHYLHAPGESQFY